MMMCANSEPPNIKSVMWLLRTLFVAKRVLRAQNYGAYVPQTAKGDMCQQGGLLFGDSYFAHTHHEHTSTWPQAHISNVIRPSSCLGHKRATHKGVAQSRTSTRVK